MNAIRSTQALNKLELENAVTPSASWHADYRDTAYVYIGGLPLDLSEGDVIAIFSQYGNPTHLNLVREKDTGKSRGFAFLKYEDQRSCDLAVDNLGGAEVFGRLLRVDHTRYKKREGEDEDTWRIERLERQGETEGGETPRKRGSESENSEEERERRKRRKRIGGDDVPVLKEERELQEMLAVTQNGEEEDPMREYLIREKRVEVERARERQSRKDGERKHRHHHHRRHRDEGRDRDETRAEKGDDRRSRRHRDGEDKISERSDRDDGKKYRDVDRDSLNPRRDRDRRKETKPDMDVDDIVVVERNRRPHRSRSPDDRERRRKDRTRDRDDEYSNREKGHSRKDYESREERRRRRSPQGRRRDDFDR